MSKNETPMTLWYWEQIGGTLVEEFMVVPRAENISRRLIDGLIIKGDKKVRLPIGSRPNIEGKDVVAIQAKYTTLGMYLIGQTIFSRELVLRLNPRSVISVALCIKNDAILGPMLETYEGCKVVVCPKEIVMVKSG